MFTPAAQPGAVWSEIQWPPLPRLPRLRGHEWPMFGRPVDETLLVQSLQVLPRVPPYWPRLLLPVGVSWLSTPMWLGRPSSLGRSLTTRDSPTGRGPARRPALFMDTSRPRRSYQGPSPMRSMAFTAPP